MFLTSLIGPGKAMRYPAHSNKVDWESELAVVIGVKVGDKVDASIEGIGTLAVELIEDPHVIHSAYAEH